MVACPARHRAHGQPALSLLVQKLRWVLAPGTSVAMGPASAETGFVLMLCCSAGIVTFIGTIILAELFSCSSSFDITSDTVMNNLACRSSHPCVGQIYLSSFIQSYSP